MADADLNAQGKGAAAEHDPYQWVQESLKLAGEKVYVVEIREQILAADKAPKPTEVDDRAPLVTVQLPDGYRDRAHELGKLRVVQGGYRTAEFFRGL